jgi:hypothetical protein
MTITLSVDGGCRAIAIFQTVDVSAAAYYAATGRAPLTLEDPGASAAGWCYIRSAALIAHRHA